MIEHLQDHLIGLVHLVVAVIALLVGAGVVFNRKGTRLHRWMGRGYLVSMLALNVTALMIYELQNRFGPFHWLALISLASILGGYWAARARPTGWRYSHAYFMVGSYVGLAAAAVAETASRVPGWSFGASVMISSAVVIAVGCWLMWRMVPGTIRD